MVVQNLGQLFNISSVYEGFKNENVDEAFGNSFS
jgi:hypothetical protein